MSDGKGSMSYFKVTLPGSLFPWDAHISSDGVPGQWPGRKAAARNLLHRVCVRTVTLVDHTGILRSDCSGGGKLPCTFLAHDERENVLVMITAIIVQH